MNQSWIDLLASASGLSIAAALLFGTVWGKRWVDRSRKAIGKRRNPVFMAMATGSGTLAVTVFAYVIRIGWTLDPVLLANTLLLPLGMGAITFYSFRR